jgi:hypothetical protein
LQFHNLGQVLRAGQALRKIEAGNCAEQPSPPREFDSLLSWESIS